MLTLHIEADTFASLVQLAFQRLGISAGAPVASAAYGLPVKAAEPETATPEAGQGPQTPSAAVSLSSEPNRRGRKTNAERAKLAETPPAGADVVPAAQAQVANSVSAPTALPRAVEGAAGVAGEPELTVRADAPVGSPAPAPLTFEDVHGTLKDLMQANPPFEKGGQIVANLCAEFGYKKVRDINGHVEHYAPIVVKAREMMKGA